MNLTLCQRWAAGCRSEIAGACFTLVKLPLMRLRSDGLNMSAGGPPLIHPADVLPGRVLSGVVS